MNVYTEIRHPSSRGRNRSGHGRRASKSHFETRVNPRSVDEIGQLAADFNRMTLALGEAQDEIIRQNRILEKRVNEATSELRSRNLGTVPGAGPVAASQQACNSRSDGCHAGARSRISAELHLRTSCSSCWKILPHAGRTKASQPDPESGRTAVGYHSKFSEQRQRNGRTFHTDRFERINLHLIELTEPLLAERKITAHVTTDPALPLLTADPNQLQQLFLNLFTNAMDAMREGGELRVTTGYVPESSGSRSGDRESGRHGHRYGA